MRIVFFGTSDFAVPGLAKLAGRHKIAAVITKPDRPQGRRLLVTPSPVKVKALELGIPVFSIEEIPAVETVERLRGCRADLFVVIAYGRILASDILSLPKLYPIGLHASLLPKYRGASPINWVILNGENRTGVTVFKLIGKMDAGDIIMQETAEILGSDNAQTLSVKLSVLGADLLLRATEAIEKNEERFVKQREDEATFTPKLKKEDGFIDWAKSSAEIRNRVRAMYGWPGAFSNLHGRKIKILAAEIGDPSLRKDHKPGEVIEAGGDGIRVSCGKGVIEIKELQAEGARRLPATGYLLGHKVSAGDFFLSFR